VCERLVNRVLKAKPIMFVLLISSPRVVESYRVVKVKGPETVSRMGEHNIVQFPAH
jgi:hypothetical protein